MAKYTKRGLIAEALQDMLRVETDDCVEWPFPSPREGYPDPVKTPLGRMRPHRYICFATHGAPPVRSMDAAHSCDVKRCANKRHLRWATRRENGEDRYRHWSPETGYSKTGGTSARLTPPQVQAIRSSGRTMKEEAAAHGVSYHTVRLARLGKTWGHLP